MLLLVWCSWFIKCICVFIVWRSYFNNVVCGGGGMFGEYVKVCVDNLIVTIVIIGYGGIGVSVLVGVFGGIIFFGNIIIVKGGFGGNVFVEGIVLGVVGLYGVYIELGFIGVNIIGFGSGYSLLGVWYFGSLVMGGFGGDLIFGVGVGL